MNIKNALSMLLAELSKRRCLNKSQKATIQAVINENEKYLETARASVGWSAHPSASPAMIANYYAAKFISGGEEKNANEFFRFAADAIAVYGAGGRIYVHS